MVHSLLRRSAAALALASILSLSPGIASAASRPRGDHGRAASVAKPRVENQGSRLWSRLALFLFEKMPVRIDPNGLTTNPDPNDPH